MKSKKEVLKAVPQEQSSERLLGTANSRSCASSFTRLVTASAQRKCAESHDSKKDDVFHILVVLFVNF
ncbi:MAG: hypothetical protein KBF76_10300, partial [Verrucomicrobiales bacterium]|nr:hypothetical protein [Verrucomicrobiales bacterium]